MSPIRSRQLVAVSLIVLAVALASPARVQAATFNLFYDGVADGAIGTSAIIGTGTFSYDGPITIGSFALSALSGVSFNAIVLGQPFDTDGIQVNTATSGISVFSIGGGEFGMVFTGHGGFVYDAALDVVNGSDTVLTHEPTAGIDVRVGLGGGTGTINGFQLINPPILLAFGDYMATTATAVPEPGTSILLAIGLAGLGARRRKLSSTSACAVRVRGAGAAAPVLAPSLP